MLHGELLPLMAEVEDKKTIFQQDNALIHTFASTEKWFQDFGIELLSRPASSSDLNAIENLRRILTRKVYDREDPPVENIVKLEKRIKFAWANVRSEIFNKLVDSVPNELTEIIKNKGKSTKC